MHLAPRDVDKVLLHQVGTLAQKRLARGLRLNYPEAVALLATVLLERIRDGVSVAHLMAEGKTILGRNQVLEGIPDLVHEVQVEGTFPDGTKLVTVHEPIVADDGNLELALYGSFLPVPTQAFSAANADLVPIGARPFATASEFPRTGAPGEVLVEDAPIVLNEGRDVIELTVTSVGDRPIQVGSHFPFEETNQALQFDRAKAVGMRLCIPAGTAIRFEPGETKKVPLIPYVASRADLS